jgi:hypothetical protein
MTIDWDEESYEEGQRVHEQLLSRFRIGMLEKIGKERRSEMTESIIRLANVEVLPDNPVISEAERYLMHVVLQKLATCAKANARLGDLYEPQTLTKKNVSCEMVGYNERGEVYLVQRPSKEEKPDEPFPLQWHVPGSGLEPYDHWEDVFMRVARKFGEDVILQNIKFVSPTRYPYIVHDPPRGPYLLQIFTATICGKPDNPRGMWFTKAEAMKLDLVESHRKYILPAGFGWHNLA